MPKLPDSNIEELIVRSLQGRVSRFEAERLRAWRKACSDNEASYQAFCEIWSTTGAVSPAFDAALPDFSTLMAAADKAEKDHSKKLGMDEDRDKRQATNRRAVPVSTPSSARSRWFRWAARGLVAAGLVGLGLTVGISHGTEDAGFLARGEIVTGAGEMTTVTLPDGSSIRLGPSSRLRLDEDESRRIARLEGRAFFGVEPDSEKPFTVFTEYGEAVVLGTRFEVRTEHEEFRVLVVEGEVSVSANGSSVTMTEGEMSRSSSGKGLATERVADVYEHLAWLGNAMVLQATPLHRAALELERRSALNVEIVDSSLRDIGVTATFTGQPVEDVVFVICEVVDAICHLEGDELRMEK